MWLALLGLPWLVMCDGHQDWMGTWMMLKGCQVSAEEDSFARCIIPAVYMICVKTARNGESRGVSIMLSITLFYLSLTYQRQSPQTTRIPEFCK